VGGVDSVTLARAQFAFTMGFHIIFPAFSIGLASYLAVLEALWLKNGEPVYLAVFTYWKKIFAVVFGVGVVSGVVISYQFGTNWSVYSDKAGPIVGPLMGYEVLSAFFLESGFLGVMLFGMRKVGPGLHFFATLMVAAGTLLSAFWILSANSWMQTPAGYTTNDAGQFVAVDWFAVVFNPSFPFRFVHMVLAAYLTTALVVGGVGGFHLLRDRANASARVMFSMAMWMAALVAPIQIVAGDQHGLNTLEHQPAKIAAMEGDFDTKAGQPLILIGLPDMKAEKTKFAIEIPDLGSLVLTHDIHGVVRGLKDWPPDQRPDATIIFFSFRIMVGLGFAIFGLGLWSLWARRKGTLFEWPWLHRAAIVLSPAGFIAVLAGWTTTEVGRQPYTVYGLLTTAQSVSPIAPAGVGASLTGFVIVYFCIFGSALFYCLRLMAKPPELAEPDLQPGVPIRAAGVTPIAAIKPDILSPTH